MNCRGLLNVFEGDMGVSDMSLTSKLSLKPDT